MGESICFPIGGGKSGFRSAEKKIARLPCAHKEIHCRCFLPDLTGFVILYCTGPGYHTDDHLITKKKRLRSDYFGASVLTR